jgi:hypothetical protein
MVYSLLNVKVLVDCGTEILFICDKVLYNKFCCEYVLDLPCVLLQFTCMVGHSINLDILVFF